MKKLTYVFTCPICSKLFRSDEPGEPMCTGPSEMRDDHDMLVMRLLRIDREDVNPAYAEKRAEGTLLMPNMEKAIERDTKLIIASR